MSTGYLDEAERCDELIYLYKGQIRVHGSPTEIKSNFPWNAYRLHGDLAPATITQLRHAAWVRRVHTIAGNLLVTTSLPRTELDVALQNLSSQDVRIEAVLPTLEMVFAELTEQAEQTLHIEQGEKKPPPYRSSSTIQK
jgi:ABC-type multidrug transport system ATPase subunit